MLRELKIQRYKSLFDVQVALAPLTVFIGPNGSGKSNICEAVALTSTVVRQLLSIGSTHIISVLQNSIKELNPNNKSIESKFWSGSLDYFSITCTTSTSGNSNSLNDDEFLELTSYGPKELKITLPRESTSRVTISSSISSLLQSKRTEYPRIFSDLEKVKIYDFAPNSLSTQSSSQQSMSRSGEGIAYALVDLLLQNRAGFDELESRLIGLVPNIQSIALPRLGNQSFSLELVDKYSKHHIPASDISDGTLRLLGFLAALYQEDSPSILCFEEIENGIHPWLLHKIIELLKIVSTEGILGRPVQIFITTHSPVLLNYIAPQQIRAVELDNEGKTQVHELPVESTRFQKTLEAYDGALGELWFTNIFGGNPE